MILMTGQKHGDLVYSKHLIIVTIKWKKFNNSSNLKKEKLVSSKLIL